jgi:hypothetical protein
MDPVLREQIQAGTYRVDPNRVAAAMVARMAQGCPSAVLVAPEAGDLLAVRADEPQPLAILDEA